MSLANFLLRWALGNERPPERLDVALFNGSYEVKDPGYKRAEIQKGAWNIQNEKVTSVATFGPFRGSLEYDRSRILRGELVVDEQRFPGDAARRAGATDVIRVDVVFDLKAV